MGAEYPHLLEVAERLRDNVAQLHRSVCLFMGQAWNKVGHLRHECISDTGSIWWLQYYSALGWFCWLCVFC